MFDILSSSIERVVGLIGAFGYTGVFWLSFLDRLTVFLIPAEIVLPAFGILVSQDIFSFWPVMIWVSIGSFLGNLALYYIFRKGGRVFLEKYGWYLLISKHDLSHLEQWFSKYGDWLVLIGYIVPTSIRSLVPILAGVSRMNTAKFLIYTLIGFIPLNLLYVVVGIKAGDNLDKIFNYFEKFNYFIIAAIIILIIWYVYRHINKKHLTHD